MWVKLLTGIFVICLLALIYCLYRLNLYSPPQPKGSDTETNPQTWPQQKQLVGSEIEGFLAAIDLPCFLLEPRIYNQQLELLRFPNNKRYGDWRYESNEELILSSLQRPLHEFLQSLKQQGCSLQGLEEDFLKELVRRIAMRNYKRYWDEYGDFITGELDFPSACLRFLEALGLDQEDLAKPYLMESLVNYYKEPMVFKSTPGSRDHFNRAVGMLDFLQKYFQIKGVTAAPMPIKELSDKLEEAFSDYQSRSQIEI